MNNNNNNNGNSNGRNKQRRVKTQEWEIANSAENRKKGVIKASLHIDGWRPLLYLSPRSDYRYSKNISNNEKGSI